MGILFSGPPPPPPQRRVVDSAQTRTQLLKSTIALTRENLESMQERLARCLRVKASLLEKTKRQDAALTPATCECGTDMQTISQFGEVTRFDYTAPTGGADDDRLAQLAKQLQKQYYDTKRNTELCLASSKKLSRQLQNVQGSLRHLKACERCGKVVS